MSTTSFDDDAHPRDLANGQFVEPSRTDQGAEVLNMWTAQGTFDFPPVPRTAQDLITFWANVEVPDDAAASLMAAYRWRSYQEIERTLQAVLNQYRQMHPNASPAQINDVSTNNRAEITNRVNKKYPELKYVWGPAMVRIVRMNEQAASLPEPDRTTVLSQKVILPGDLGPRTSGTDGTVQGLAGRLGLMDLQEFARTQEHSLGMDERIGHYFQP